MLLLFVLPLLLLLSALSPPLKTSVVDVCILPATKEGAVIPCPVNPSGCW
jgi:hypothetical protein